LEPKNSGLKLHELAGLTHLHVEPSNKVTRLQFWKEYLIQKLGNIQSINGSLISSTDFNRATILFGTYFETQSQLPFHRQCEINQGNKNENRFRYASWETLSGSGRF